MLCTAADLNRDGADIPMASRVAGHREALVPRTRISRCTRSVVGEEGRRRSEVKRGGARRRGERGEKTIERIPPLVRRREERRGVKKG
jgi:hypothetical protein